MSEKEKVDQNADDGIEEVPFDEGADPDENEIQLEADIDLDDIDDDDDEEEEDEDDEVARRPKRTKVDDEMLTAKNERAVLANPKRENIVRRTRAELVNGIDFDDPTALEKIWDQLEERNSGVRARKYNLKKGDYTETDVLKHDKFGKGYILEVVSDGKIAVLFEDGLKKLAINRR